MIRIAISQVAFEASARTLPLGSMRFENKIDENGDRLIWLEPVPLGLGERRCDGQEQHEGVSRVLRAQRA